jgi:hypothetical protein
LQLRRFLSRCHFDRSHIAFQVGYVFIFGNFQIVFRLKIQPEARRGLEIAAQPQCGIRREPRRPATMSAMRVTGTRKSSANLFMLSR